jgi:hypothetical protein
MSKKRSADLILKLYDLRREETMRKARNWMFGFNPTSVEDVEKTMMDPEVGGYLRMVLSYWDMAGAMVNQGYIDPELFYATVFTRRSSPLSPSFAKNGRCRKRLRTSKRSFSTARTAPSACKRPASG